MVFQQFREPGVAGIAGDLTTVSSEYQSSNVPGAALPVTPRAVATARAVATTLAPTTQANIGANVVDRVSGGVAALRPLLNAVWAD